MRFLVHTYGCQMNVRDSEAVAALLVAAGHEEVASEDAADLVLINSCTVRQKAEEKAIGKAGNLLAAGKVVGLMGCAVKRLGADVFTRLPKLHFAVGPRRFGLIPKIVADARYPTLELGDDEVPEGLDAHPDTRRAGTFAQVQSYVTVLLGCDNRCSYCIVPDVRGHEYSRPAKEVIEEVRCLAARGVKEVCLLGQSVLRYGIRNEAWETAGGEPFPRLLRALQEIDGLERIRFTSAHPKGCTDELLAAYRDCPKVCRHLHLPVQSGSDRILAEMGRHYTRAERRNQVLLADQEIRGQRRNDALVGTVREVMAEGPSKRNKARLSGRDSGNRIVVWDAPDGARPAIGSTVRVRIDAAHPQILVGTRVA